MRHDQSPRWNDQSDAIEDAIDFPKRDPKKPWDELGRKNPSPPGEQDEEQKGNDDGKVAAKSRAYKERPASMIASL